VVHPYDLAAGGDRIAGCTVLAGAARRDGRLQAHADGAARGFGLDVAFLVHNDDDDDVA
jgi:hypothetical protein